MTVRAHILAAAIVLPTLNAGADELRSAGQPGIAGLPAGGAVPSPSVDMEGGTTAAAAGEGLKRASDRPGPASQTGSGTGGPESAAGHQAAAKPLLGDRGREDIWDSPIDTSITVHQGRTPNKGQKGIGVAVRGIAQRLRNRTKPAPVPGVVIHHDAHDEHQQPTQAPSRLFFRIRAGIGFPARNAIGASIAADHDASFRGSHSAQQSPFLPGTGKTASGAQGASLPAMASAPVVTDYHRVAQQIIGSAVGAHDLAAMAAGGPAISGTAMVRPGSGAGAIGGAAKAMTGVISGANVRMRHP